MKDRNPEKTCIFVMCPKDDSVRAHPNFISREKPGFTSEPMKWVKVDMRSEFIHRLLLT